MVAVEMIRAVKLGEVNVPRVEEQFMTFFCLEPRSQEGMLFDPQCYWSDLLIFA